MNEENVKNKDSGEVKKEEAPLSKKQKIIKETKSIFLILLSVFVFRAMFFEPFRIPTGSMIPTLMIGDFILVNKLSYGLKVPFSDFSLGDIINLNPIYLMEFGKPERGDVIVFKYPKDPSINYIKRVVGLPGDEIEIREKVVYVNGQEIQSEMISGKEIMEDMDDKFKGYDLEFRKANTGKHEHVIQLDKENRFKINYDKRTIPQGMYFVMGDNRDFSYDSRFWGFVPFENIKGRALFVWFSMIFPFSENNFKFRPWRIGTAID